MSARREDWLLYVDESGQFDSGGAAPPTEPLVVGGFLLRGSEHPDHVLALRTEIERIFPTASWPPHASVLRVPASRVWLALANAGAPSPERERALAQARPAVEVVQRSRTHAAEALREAARRPGEPDYALLLAVDALVRRENPGAHARLVQLVRNEFAAFQAFLRHAAESVVRGNMLAVAGAGTQFEDAPAAGPGQVAHDRYLDALETLFERVLMVVREQPRAANTDVRIWCRVATRGVTLGEMRPRTWPSLNAHYVAEAARRAASVPALPGRVTPRIVPSEFVTRYDATVHPGVVLADFAANQMRHVLTGQAAHPGWAALAHGVTRALGVPPTRAVELLGGRELPAIAAPDVPRAAVAAAFRGGEIPELAGEPMVWAREQAAAWVAEVEKARP